MPTVLLAVVLAALLGCAPAAPVASAPVASPPGEAAHRTGPGPLAGCGADVPGLERRLVPVGGGVVLHVALAGPPDAPPVVLLHGFPETWRTWRGVATDLAADHRVIVPDQRGAGCSSEVTPGADPDAATRAGDLAALATALGLPPAVVVGHDMGAMPAFAWARTRPDQVAHLVLSGGGIPGWGLAERAPPHVARFAAAPPGVLAAGLAGRERAFLADFVASSGAFTRGSLDDAVAAYTRPGRLDAAFGWYRSLPRDAAANRAEERPLTVPATALEGGAPGISAATLAGVAPDRDVVVVPGAGHYLQQDAPQATAAALRTLAAGS